MICRQVCEQCCLCTRHHCMFKRSHASLVLPQLMLQAISLQVLTSDQAAGTCWITGPTFSLAVTDHTGTDGEICSETVSPKFNVGTTKKTSGPTLNATVTSQIASPALCAAVTNQSVISLHNFGNNKQNQKSTQYVRCVSSLTCT